MTVLRPCPKCRGYDLERRWCGLCDGRGVIDTDRRAAILDRMFPVEVNFDVSQAEDF